MTLQRPVALPVSSSFLGSSRNQSTKSHKLLSTRLLAQLQDGDDRNADDWDSDVDYDKEFPQNSDASMDPSLDWNAPKSVQGEDATPKLGIDIGRMLEPLSEKEAAELKAAATEVINDAIAEGIDEIEKLRTRMNKELEKKRKEMEFASEMNAQRESEKLMSKIDDLTNAFLSDTEFTRRSTKMAAAADRAMEGEGIEVGVWGNLDGAAVTTAGGAKGLLGSVEAAARQKSSVSTSEDAGEEGVSVLSTANRGIVIVADSHQDPYAKQIVPRLTDLMEEILPGLPVNIYKPSATLPLGGDNAACAILFATSLSDKSSVSNSLDRLLRKTLQAGGAVGQPPTQLILVSTLGTERTNKMPYSMQNMMGGGKLDKRRQMEETIINTVRDRVVEPSLDFTICKFGELKDSTNENFQLMPGDALDGNVAVDTAVKILKEAIAFQPAARNATLCCIGSMPSDISQETLDDEFLRLDGPELMRMEVSASVENNYAQLVEYLREWAELLEESGKGLTTPIRTERVVGRASSLTSRVKKQEGTQLLFLPTATGKNYLSRNEEAALEKEGSAARRKINQFSKKKEGGIEVVVEVLQDRDDALRIRAKRCNYADDAVIKELSESTILKRLEEAIETWKRDHRQS